MDIEIKGIQTQKFPALIKNFLVYGFKIHIRTPKFLTWRNWKRLGTPWSRSIRTPLPWEHSVPVLHRFIFPCFFRYAKPELNNYINLFCFFKKYLNYLLRDKNSSSTILVRKSGFADLSYFCNNFC